jgi:hypothetical protein
MEEQILENEYQNLHHSISHSECEQWVKWVASSGLLPASSLGLLLNESG